MNETEINREISIEKITNNTGVDVPEKEVANKKYIIISIIVIIIIVALLGLASYFLLTADPAVTEQIRDVFLIFMALVSLVIGIALVVLIIQLSSLINLLQNEIRPIINSTNETVNTLKGTTKFISNNLTEPVIKINQLLAMINRLIRPKRK